jgi:hypothetical protein
MRQAAGPWRVVGLSALKSAPESGRPPIRADTVSSTESRYTAEEWPAQLKIVANAITSAARMDRISNATRVLGKKACKSQGSTRTRDGWGGECFLTSYQIMAVAQGKPVKLAGADTP